MIRHKKGVAPTEAAEQFHAVARRILDEADAAKNLSRKPAGKQTLTLALMRTLDVARPIAILKPLTASPDVALRLIGRWSPPGSALPSSPKASRAAPATSLVRPIDVDVKREVGLAYSGKCPEERTDAQQDRPDRDQ